VRVRERFGNEFSLLELDLRTGRTHQIRVHLSHLGWPIVGDDMYGGRAYEEDGNVVIARQALHAAMLSFTHPVLGTRLTFTAPLRGDMAGLVRSLRARGPVERTQVTGTILDLDALMA
jgi:23S rRNA-/tRNA-specific pseudouridylate synthase